MPGPRWAGLLLLAANVGRDRQALWQLLGSAPAAADKSAEGIGRTAGGGHGVSRKLPPSRFEILAARLVEAVAPRLVERVAELIAERYGEPPPLLDSEGAAAYVGVDAETIRRWTREGVIPSHVFGDGPRARLRFDPVELREQSFRPAYVTRRDAIRADVNGSSKTSTGAAKVE